MKNTNYLNAFCAITNLSEALEDCGIPTNLTVDDERIHLSAPLWNCHNGKAKVLEVCAMDIDDFEIESAVSDTNEDYDDFVEQYYN